jgi:hypothetical protein
LARHCFVFVHIICGRIQLLPSIVQGQDGRMAKWRNIGLTLLLLAMGLVFALPAWAQQQPVAPGFSPAAKPFTQDQVQGLVRDGLGDESGAKLIEQRGIDFTPADDFLQSLKAAGASEAFLKALRAAKPPEPAIAGKPLNQVHVFVLLAGIEH